MTRNSKLGVCASINAYKCVAIAIAFLVVSSSIPAIPYATASSNELLKKFEKTFFALENLTSTLDVAVVVGFMSNGIENVNNTLLSYHLEAGTTNSLTSKLDAALDRTQAAGNFVLKGNIRQTNEMINATDNILSAFENQVQALSGKKISTAEASTLISLTQSILNGSSLRGTSTIPLVSSADLTILEELRQEIPSAIQHVRDIVQELQQAGIQVQIKILDNPNEDIVVVIVILGIIIAVDSALLSYFVTQRVADLMAAKGKPLSSAQWWEVFLANFVIFAGIQFAALAALRNLSFVAASELLMLLPIGALTADYIVHLYADHQVQDLLKQLLPGAEAFILNVVLPTLSTTSVSITLTNSQSSATPINFTQMLHLNPSKYASSLNSNLGNIRFFSDSVLTHHLPAWLENASSTPTSDTNDIVWVNMMNDTIPASSSVTIYVVFGPTTTTFDSNFWGEAPQLSAIYSTPTVNAQSSNTATSAKSVTCTVNVSNVGDLLYAQIVPDQLAPAGVTITDSQNNHYSYHSQTGIFVTWVAAVAASTTGPDTITFSNTNTIPALDIYCYDVSGVSTTLSAFSQTSASGAGPSTTMTVPAFSTFNKPGFTAALYDEFTSRSVSVAAGAGFTQATGSPINDGYQLMASQYSTTVTGSTQCPMTVSASENWIAECDNFAPAIASGYGQYDNGANVFTFYDNFHGTSLDTKWNTVITGDGTYSVNNGLSVDSDGNSNENGVQVYTSQTFNGNYAYETHVGAYNQGTGGGCDCHLGLGFQVTPPSDAFVITMNGYAFWHYGFFNVYFIASPCCNAYSSTASLPPAPFTVSAIWTQGSQILMMGYTPILTWSDTLVSYSPNHFGIFSSSWRGDNSQTVNYARVRVMPPNNVMPSVSFGSP